MTALAEFVEEFIDMGGYGPYVWSAYAVAAVVLAGNLLIPVLRAREVKRRLSRRSRFEHRSAGGEPA